MSLIEKFPKIDIYNIICRRLLLKHSPIEGHCKNVIVEE